MKHKIIPILIAIWASIATLLTAQISPEAKAIIDDFNEATGGISAKNSVNTMIQIGTWEMVGQNIKGPMTQYYKLPDSFVAMMDIPDVGTVKSCYTEGTAWEDNSITGFRTLEDTELQQAAKDSCLFPEAHIEDFYNRIMVQEPRGDGMLTLLLIDKDGFEETWYFDPFTHYLNEVHRVLDAGARGSYQITVKMTNYQPVGDLVLPHVIETSTPAFKVITRTEKTEINAEIPAYIFKRPDGN